MKQASTKIKHNLAKDLASFVAIIISDATTSLTEKTSDGATTFSAKRVYKNTASNQSASDFVDYTTTSLSDKSRIRSAWADKPKTATASNLESPLQVKPLDDYKKLASALLADDLAKHQTAEQEAEDRLAKAKKALERAEEALARATIAKAKATSELNATKTAFHLDGSQEERDASIEDCAKHMRRASIAKALAHCATKTAEGKQTLASVSARHHIKPSEAVDLVKAYATALGNGAKTKTGDEFLDRITSDLIKALRKIVEIKA